eukprot:401084_1
MNQVDSNTFKIDHDNDVPCNGEKDYIQCECMKRLFAALRHYSLLDILQNENDREAWNKFINEVYDNLVDDYVHFNNNHSHELENINNEITNNKTILNPCQISKCTFTSRHHNKESKTNGNHLNPTEKFYKQTMDSFHFYLFHCFDVGLRVKNEQKEEKDDEKKK